MVLLVDTENKKLIEATNNPIKIKHANLTYNYEEESFTFDTSNDKLPYLIIYN